MSIKVNIKQVRGNIFWFWCDIPVPPYGDRSKEQVEGICRAKSSYKEKAWSDVKSNLSTKLFHLYLKYPRMDRYSMSVFQPEWEQTPTVVHTIGVKPDDSPKLYEVVRTEKGSLELITHEKELLTKDEAAKVMFERAVNGN